MGRAGLMDDEGAGEHPGRQVAAGTARLFAAEALVIPTGLLAAAFLTRRLGPELYGVFTVATAIVVWAELATATLLSRTAIKLVSETDDWTPVAAHLLKLQLMVGIGMALVLMFGAPVFATILAMPSLSSPLRLLAVDVPIFALTSMHKALLIGRGSFSRAAAPAAAHWIVRFVLILVLVGLGLSLTGAILATVGGSIAALMLMRRSLRVPLRSRAQAGPSRVWGYAPYLFFSALALQLFNRLDLLMVAALSTAAGIAGIYGAAQNLAIVPGLLAGSFSPLLLSTLTAALRTGEPVQFRGMVAQSIKGCLWLLPFVAAGAAAAPEVVTFVYGPAFAASGSIASILILGAMAVLLLSVSGAIWTAIGQPRRNLAFTIPLVPAAAAAHFFVIPRFGGEGAAVVTATAAWLSATVALVVVLRRSGSDRILNLLLRVFATTAGVYLLARNWEMPGFKVLIEFPVLAGLIVGVLWAIGELRSLEVWFHIPAAQGFVSSPESKVARREPSKRLPDVVPMRQGGPLSPHNAHQMSVVGDDGPSVSVVVASYNARATIELCLESLERQDYDGPMEVIVVDSSTDGTADAVGRRFPWVRLHRSHTRCYPGDARNIGVAQARGEILAFTDADCVVASNWVCEIVLAHRKGSPVIGGTVDNGNPESYVGWAAYFCEFSRWIPGTPNQPKTEIPTCNLSIKRWVFDSYGPFLEGTYCSDTAFHWKIGAVPLRPLFVPSVRIFHQNISEPGRFLRKQIMHGRSFAKVRVIEQRLSTGRILTLVMGSGLLPILLFARMSRRLVRKVHYRRQFLIAAPLAFVGTVMWSYGELLGYLQCLRTLRLSWLASERAQ